MASHSEGPVVTGVAIGFLALTVVVLSLRLFSRIGVLGKMAIDDCKSLLCLLLASPRTSTMLMQTFHRPNHWRLRKTD